ncbi:hypothetical protein ACPEIC_40415 [Stenotrophomonas sp. NPDC087984]
MSLPHDATLIRQKQPAEGAYGLMSSAWTGKVVLVCNCGYVSGWTTPDEIRDDIYTHLTEPTLQSKPFAAA